MGFLTTTTLWFTAVWGLAVSGLMLLAVFWPRIDKEFGDFEVEVESTTVITAIAGAGFVASLGTIIALLAGLTL